MKCLSSGERAGTHQGGSVRHGLQARQWTGWCGKSWSRGCCGRKALEKTWQQEQEGESTSSEQAPGRLRVNWNQLYLQGKTAGVKRKIQPTIDSLSFNAEPYVDSGSVILYGKIRLLRSYWCNTFSQLDCQFYSTVCRNGRNATCRGCELHKWGTFSSSTW